MIEKVVSENFNVFDIFVRFGPGCMNGTQQLELTDKIVNELIYVEH